MHGAMVRLITTLMMLVGAYLVTSSARGETLAERGRYLVGIMDCTACHTDGALAGKPDPAKFLAGSGIGLEIPDLGIFYPPNLTSDRATGLGAWSEQEIITALRTGARPDGRELAPIMPWQSYAGLTDGDVQAIAAYLKSLPPVEHAVPRLTGPSEKAPAPYVTVVMPK